MDSFNTPRLARRRSAANIDRIERARHTGEGNRAAYSARCYNRADRQASREALRSLTR